VREAFDFGPPPPQQLPADRRAVLADLPTGDDWLTVNVWTPEPDPAARRPVMVWIYGGGYTVGLSAAYDASRICRDGDLVVATSNYRWASRGSPGSTGPPRTAACSIRSLPWSGYGTTSRHSPATRARSRSSASPPGQGQSPRCLPCQPPRDCSDGPSSRVCPVCSSPVNWPGTSGRPSRPRLACARRRVNCRVWIRSSSPTPGPRSPVAAGRVSTSSPGPPLPTAGSSARAMGWTDRCCSATSAAPLVPCLLSRGGLVGRLSGGCGNRRSPAQQLARDSDQHRPFGAAVPCGKTVMESAQAPSR